MKRILLSLLFIFFCISINFAQKTVEKKAKPEFWKHVQFGGGLTLNFYNRTTNLGVSPSAIYNFNDQFSAGIGVSYLYSKHKDFTNSVNAYGGSLIALYNPFRGVQFSSEFEQTYLTSSGSSRSVPALFFGVGYNAGRNMAIGIRYDVLYDDDKSLYGSAFMPFVRVYF